MMNLFELHYQIQKNIYFTGKVANNNFNIYYNDIVPEMYWNYGMISNLIPVKNIIPDLISEFKDVGRTPCLYVNALHTKEFSEAIEQKFRVNFTESWLRYDGEALLSPLRAERVETPKDEDAFVKLFSEDYSEKNAYLEKVTPEHLNLVRLSLSAPHTESYIIYENGQARAAATIGSHNGYYMIFNLTTSRESVNNSHKESVINSCLEYYKENGGKSLLVKISNDRILEKWFGSLGFNLVASGHRMSL